MAKKLVLATKNQNKLLEFKKLFSDDRIEIVSLDVFETCPEVVEDGATFAENAVKKARVTAEFTGMSAVADDSGLEVFYLNGEPGVFSARYGGKEAKDADRCRMILDRMLGAGESQRGARFVCALAIAWSPDEIEVVQEECLGRIHNVMQGGGGFGYDPVFFVPELGKTMAQLTLEEKNRISHRGKAFRSAKALIEKRMK